MHQPSNLVVSIPYVFDHLSFAHYDASRGEWWELFNEHYPDSVYYKQTLFWRGAGYLQEHSHADADEQIDILFGEAIYYIDGRRYIARAGETIVIPRGTLHINPFCSGKGYLILVHKNPDPALVEFLKHYYEQMKTGDVPRSSLAATSVPQLRRFNLRFCDAIEFRLDPLYFLRQLMIQFESIW